MVCWCDLSRWSADVDGFVTKRKKKVLRSECWVALLLAHLSERKVVEVARCRWKSCMGRDMA